MRQAALVNYQYCFLASFVFHYLAIVKRGYISIKIYLISLFAPTYFAAAVSCSELKPTLYYNV